MAYFVAGRETRKHSFTAFFGESVTATTILDFPRSLRDTYLHVGGPTPASACLGVLRPDRWIRSCLRSTRWRNFSTIDPAGAAVNCVAGPQSNNPGVISGTYDLTRVGSLIGFLLEEGRFIALCRVPDARAARSPRSIDESRSDLGSIYAGSRRSTTTAFREILPVS